MRRDINFKRTVITIRQMLSELFLREKKPTLDFTLHPSPFTFSLETPINTGVARGEGLSQPFTAVNALYIGIYVVKVKGEGCFCSSYRVLDRLK